MDSKYLVSINRIKQSREQKILLKKTNLELNLKVWNMLDFPYPYTDSFFSAVNFYQRVIHHTTKEKIRQIAQEISRMTKAYGYLFIEVPMLEKLNRLKR